MDEFTDNMKQSLRTLGHEAEEVIDFLKHQLRTRFKPDAPLEIVAYRGFGNQFRSSLTGRVLAYRKPQSSDLEFKDLESKWNNLQQSYRRFETDEVPGILVEAKLAGMSYQTRSDNEGYFSFDFPTPSADKPDTFDVTLTLPERSSEHSSAVGTVYVPGKAAKFGVISDIDDTVLETNATSLLQMMRLTFLESSRTRVAFSGVSAFYKALHQQVNPVFYVSSSPWNLYDFLIDFMQLNKLVAGPLLLRDFGIDQSKFIAGPHITHKVDQIRNIIKTYPELAFILIGDSGQDDAEIYASIASEFPDQILSCYIRDVSGDVRDRKVQKIINSVAKHEIDMLLVNDTLAAAVHAAARGWISEHSIDNIKVEVSGIAQAKT